MCQVVLSHLVVLTSSALLIRTARLHARVGPVSSFQIWTFAKYRKVWLQWAMPVSDAGTSRQHVAGTHFVFPNQQHDTVENSWMGAKVMYMLAGMVRAESRMLSSTTCVSEKVRYAQLTIRFQVEGHASI